MSVPSALKLRELRDKKKKPVRHAITFTLDEAKLVRMAVLAWLERTSLMRETAQSVADHLNKVLPKIETSPAFIPEERTRKYLCSRCAYASVVNPGDVCPSCSAPEGAA